MPGQIDHFDFKGKAKAFLRTYGFLATILPYSYAEWEKLSIFLTFLVPKLPAPIEDDLSKGILEAIDMDSDRVEKRAVQDIQLPDEDAENQRTGRGASSAPGAIGNAVPYRRNPIVSAAPRRRWRGKRCIGKAT